MLQITLQYTAASTWVPWQYTLHYTPQYTVAGAAAAALAPLLWLLYTPVQQQRKGGRQVGQSP